MLWPLQFISAGKSPLYLSGYVEKEKDRYGKALQEAQKQLNYSPVIEFICESMAASFAEMMRTRKEMVEVRQAWFQLGKKAAAEKTLDLLLRMPILTAGELSSQLDVSFEVASKALNKLAELKIVNEHTGFAKNRIFAAEEISYLLSREFGQDPKLSLTKARAVLRRPG